MGRLSSGFGLLGICGLLAIHACSSDEGSTGGDKKGGGGSTGTGGSSGAAGAPEGGASGDGTGGKGSGGTAGKGSTGGAGGTSGAAGQAGETTGGTSGEAGAGAGGQGGMGATGPGDTCTACMNDNAQTLQADCRTSPSCTLWMGCARDCSDDDCLDDCDAANPDVAPYRYAIYDALCSACDTECSSLALCARDCVDDVNLAPSGTRPPNLGATGLYTTGSATPDQVASYARSFQPKYELWSDGASKRRWAYIPRCSRIGTEGMNHWLFPVGTRLWKEFSAVPTGGGAPVRVETRMLHKFAEDNDTGWLYATYQWPVNDPTPTAAEAILVESGVVNANGTGHDIPTVAACPQCHAQNLVEKVLGFGAIQLSHNQPGVTIRALADAGWLTFPAAASAIGGGLARNGYAPPGTAEDQQVLGYLHANCGNCHHAGTNFGGATPARMRLMVGALGALADTDTWKSLVNVPTVRPFFATCDRIEPGYASHSEIIMRMSRRDLMNPVPQQMPPLATKVPHTAAVQGISQWINLLPSTAAPTCTPPTN